MVAVTSVVGFVERKLDSPELKTSALRNTLSAAVRLPVAFVGNCAITGIDPLTGTAPDTGATPVTGTVPATGTCGATTESGAVTGAVMGATMSVTLGNSVATGAGKAIEGRTGRLMSPSAWAEVAPARVRPPRNIPKQTVVQMVLFMMMQLQKK